MTDENKIADEKTATAIETAIKVLKETLHGGNTVPCWDIAESMIALEKPSTTTDDLMRSSAGAAQPTALERSNR